MYGTADKEAALVSFSKLALLPPKEFQELRLVLGKGALDLVRYRAGGGVYHQVLTVYQETHILASAVIQKGARVHNTSLSCAASPSSGCTVAVGQRGVGAPVEVSTSGGIRPARSNPCRCSDVKFSN